MYLVTFVGEIIIREQYLFTVCEIVSTLKAPEPGGGGGGGMGSNDECQQDFNQFVSEGQVEIGSPDETLGALSNSERPVTYTWKMYSAGTWGILSYDQAIIEYVNGPAGDIKQFKAGSFAHVGESAVGMNLGGTRTFNVINVTIRPSAFRVEEIVNFAVTHTAACIPGTSYSPLPSVTIPHSATCIFRVLNDIVVGP